jgi:type I restriction enzyme S subunit
MAEWITKTLGKLTSFISKGIPPKYVDEENDDTIRVLNQKCNRNFEISYNESRIHNTSAKKVPKNKLLHSGDILINSTGTGTAGRVAQIFNVPVPTTVDGHMILLRPTKEIESLYYGYAIKSYQKKIESLAEGSTGQTEINRQRLQDEIYITFPEDKALQKAIGIFLFQIDEKIKQNAKINNNLEQQAQALFKKWFIDNPENVDWSAGTFRELIQSTLNGDWGKETPTGNNTEKVYCIRGADIPEVKAGNKGKMPTRYILPKNLANKKLEAGDIVVEISGGSPTQSTGRCTAITQSLLDRYDSSMVCTNFCKAIKPKNGYSLFVYYYWQYLYEKGVFFSYENGTTGIKNLDFTGFIETESIIVPPFDKVQVFDDYCKSIFSQIFANGKQSEQLVSLRDALLPKLMSGELDVSDIEL